MRRQTQRAFAATFLVLMIAAFAPGPGSTVLADCHEGPSYVRVLNIYDGDIRGVLDSRTPGATIVLTQSIFNFTVYHMGDIMPRQRTTFDYIHLNSGSMFQYTTQQARSNGIIHQENEWLHFNSIPPGSLFELYGTFLDECGAGIRRKFLGYVRVTV